MSSAVTTVSGFGLPSVATGAAGFAGGGVAGRSPSHASSSGSLKVSSITVAAPYFLRTSSRKPRFWHAFAANWSSESPLAWGVAWRPRRPESGPERRDHTAAAVARHQSGAARWRLRGCGCSGRRRRGRRLRSLRGPDDGPGDRRRWPNGDRPDGSGRREANLGASTTITTTSTGKAADLKAGMNVVASGTKNSDNTVDRMAVSQVPPNLQPILGGGGRTAGGSATPGGTPGAGRRATPTGTAAP